MTTYDPSGPDPDAIATHITETFDGVDVVAMEGARFFSLDAEKHWPTFATIVTTDDFDDASNLSRPGVFRLNVGVNRETFERLVGAETSPDYAALDRVIPHPVYAAQHWISILNPSRATFDLTVKALLREAHDRLAAVRARHAAAGGGAETD